MREDFRMTKVILADPKKGNKFCKCKTVKLYIFGCILTIIFALYMKSLGKTITISPPGFNRFYLISAKLSPDCSRVAVLGEDRVKKKYYLYIISVKEKAIVSKFSLQIGQIPFAAPPEKEMEWAPNNKKLLIKAWQGWGKDGSKKYRLFLVNLEPPKIEIIDDIFPWRITQSWSKDSQSFILCRYFKREGKIVFSLYSIGLGERQLISKVIKGFPSGINCMWDLDDGAIYYWENGKGIYRSLPPYSHFEYVRPIPFLDATDFFDVWLSPSRSQLTYNTYLKKGKWRISVFDFKENKVVGSLDTDEPPLFPYFLPGKNVIVFFEPEPCGPLYIWEYEKGKTKKIRLNEDEIPLDFEPRNRCLLTYLFKVEEWHFKFEELRIRFITVP